MSKGNGHKRPIVAVYRNAQGRKFKKGHSTTVERAILAVVRTFLEDGKLFGRARISSPRGAEARVEKTTRRVEVML